MIRHCQLTRKYMCVELKEKFGFFPFKFICKYSVYIELYVQIYTANQASLVAKLFIYLYTVFVVHYSRINIL